jgi:hypothetical protein
VVVADTDQASGLYSPNVLARLLVSAEITKGRFSSLGSERSGSSICSNSAFVKSSSKTQRLTRPRSLVSKWL